MRLGLALAACLLLSACHGADKADAPAASACSGVAFDGSSFTDCIAEPAKHRVRLVLDGSDGAPLRQLNLLANRRGPNVAFAMNGGMFDELGKPIGYYVEDGNERHSLNRKRGPGNFHLLPNGIFSVDADGWHVRTTDDFAAAGDAAPDYATQSGPMLVIDGKLHPKITSDGDSRYVRNAVGIDRQGRAHFVISDEPVSFGKLARLFRDQLECANALYLDGSVSALWDPALGRDSQTVPLGPLIVVEKTASIPARHS